MVKIAKSEKNVNRLVSLATDGFTIVPSSKRTWTESQYSKREDRYIDRIITIFSIEELSRGDSDSYDSSSFCPTYLVCGDTR